MLILTVYPYVWYIVGNTLRPMRHFVRFCTLWTCFYYMIRYTFVKWHANNIISWKHIQKNYSRKYFSCVHSAVLTSCESSCYSQWVHPSLHGEPILSTSGDALLSMRGKPADAGNLTGSFAILRISLTNVTGMPHSGLAPMRATKMLFESTISRTKVELDEICHQVESDIRICL